MAPPANKNDVFRMDWLARQEYARVEHSPMLPSGEVTDKPWRISLHEMNPIRGRTIRLAIDRAMALERERDKRGHSDD